MRQMTRMIIVSLLLSANACMLQDPDPTTIDQAYTQAVAEKAAQAASNADVQPIAFATPKPPEPPPVQVYIDETVTPSPLPETGQPKSKEGKGLKHKPLSAQAMIHKAHEAALVHPEQSGYFAKSAIHRYIWQPGKLYVVHVAHKKSTKLILPPGEVLATDPWMDPDEWDIAIGTVGNDATLHDEVFLTALDAKPKTVDVSFVTERGHSFDVRLIVGPVAMFAVTWEIPRLRHRDTVVPAISERFDVLP